MGWWWGLSWELLPTGNRNISHGILQQRHLKTPKHKIGSIFCNKTTIKHPNIAWETFIRKRFEKKLFPLGIKMENTLKKGLPKSLSYSSTCVTPFQPQNHLSKIPLVNNTPTDADNEDQAEPTNQPMDSPSPSCRQNRVI